MKKQTPSPLTRHRRIFLTALLLLCTGGFLLEWLVYETDFFSCLYRALLPVLPGACLYHYEKKRQLLEKTMEAIHGAVSLNMALPIIFASIGIQLQQAPFFALYFPLCFLLCAWVAEATVYQNLDILLSFLLLDVVVFYGLSVIHPDCAAGTFSIAVMAFLFFFRIVSHHPDPSTQFDSCAKSLLAFVAAGIFINCLFGNVVGQMMRTFLTNEHSWWIYEGCSKLWNAQQWFFGIGTCSYLSQSFDLGYLASEFGLAAAIPVLLTVFVLLGSGFLLCFSFHRHISTLVIGCWVILVMRTAAYLLLGAGFDLRIADALPFFRGGFFNKTLDFLLAAILLQPLETPILESLDETDPDFGLLQAEALIQLPRSADGLVQLIRYVFNHEDREAGWELLFTEFLPLMDGNTLRILVLNADQLFDTDYFRKTYPSFFQYAADPEKVNIPENIRTVCHHNRFIDSRLSYDAQGSVLEAYLGHKETLLIPPFFRQIGFEAFRGNQTIKAVSVPGTVAHIGLCAFEDCKNLETVELRSGLEVMEAYSFAGSGLKNVVLPEGLKVIGNSAFEETALTEVRIPGSVATVSHAAFALIPTLQTVILEDGVRYIENDAFIGCSALEEIHIPDSLRYIEFDAFSGCPIRRIHASDTWKHDHPDLMYLLNHTSFL